MHCAGDKKLNVASLACNQSINQSIKTHVYSAICRERIRGALYVLCVGLSLEVDWPEHVSGTERNVVLLCAQTITHRSVSAPQAPALPSAPHSSRAFLTHSHYYHSHYYHLFSASLTY